MRVMRVMRVVRVVRVIRVIRVMRVISGYSEKGKHVMVVCGACWRGSDG